MINPNITTALQAIARLPEWEFIPFTYPSGYVDDNTYRFHSTSDLLYDMRDKVKAIVQMIPTVSFDFEDDSWYCEEEEQEHTAYVMTITTQ